MCNQWQCPHCKTIFIKTKINKEFERVWKDGVFVLGNTIYCPECKAGLDENKLLSGGFDHELAERPSHSNLIKEAKELIQKYMIEEVIRSHGDIDAITRNSVQRFADTIFEKYGLNQEQIAQLLEDVHNTH